MGVIDLNLLINKDQNITLEKAYQDLLTFGTANRLVNFYQRDFNDIKNFQKETADIYGLDDEIPSGALVLQKNLLIATAVAGKGGIAVFFEDGTKSRTLSNSGLSHCHPLNMLATIGHMARMLDVFNPTYTYARLTSKLDILDMKNEANLRFAYTHGLFGPTQSIIKSDTKGYLQTKSFTKLQEYYGITFQFNLLELIELAIKAPPTS